MTRPAWIAFDLNGTLLDPAGLLDEEHAELARRVLDDAVLQAMADTLIGEYRPFPDYLRAALGRALHVAGLGLSAQVEIVIGADEVGAYKPDPRVYRHAAARR